MIVITVELWPFGDPTHKRELGSMRIANDGTGSSEMGNYDYTVLGADGRLLKHGKGRVTRFARKRLHVWHLIGRALAQFRSARE